jgi:TfoX/Sxy family transcriptional regulator of competence genes
MNKNNSYHDFIVYDLMGKIPEISSRAMMSGWCVYSEKIPFAAIIGNQVYLKAKGEMADRLLFLGWKKFSYKKSTGKTIQMNYWQVPDELIDDREEFTKVAVEVLDSIL